MSSAYLRTHNWTGSVVHWGSFDGDAGRFRHAASQLLRSLRAENAAPRTIEAYTLAVGQMGEYLAGTSADLAATNDLRRARIENLLNALSERRSPAKSTSREGEPSRREVVGGRRRWTLEAHQPPRDRPPP